VVTTLGEEEPIQSQRSSNLKKHAMSPTLNYDFQTVIQITERQSFNTHRGSGGANSKQNNQKKEQQPLSNMEKYKQGPLAEEN